MKHQILIASYIRDFQWLRYLLQSLERMSQNFLPPAVVIPSSDFNTARDYLNGITVNLLVFDGPGFGRAQAVMMMGDKFCPEADFVYLLGSDCFAVEKFTPGTYWDREAGKPVMPYNTWPHLQKHTPYACVWKPGTEDALGGESHGEFMRRLPLVYPRAIYPAVRAAIEERHKVPFLELVYNRVNRRGFNFSESNVLGEYAWRHMQDAYKWHCLDGAKMICPEINPVYQFWSHGGMDHPSDRYGHQTPRSIIFRTLGLTMKKGVRR